MRSSKVRSASAVGGFGALPARPRRRVVVTGIGAVTPLGYSAAETWAALIAGKVGTRPITDAPYYFPNFIADDRHKSAEVKAKKYEQLIASIPCKVVAPVMPPPSLLSSSSSTAGASKAPADPYAPTSREPRAIKFALAAAQEAITNAVAGGGLAASSSSSSPEGAGADLRAFYPAERIGISLGMGMSGLQDVADASNALYAHESAVHYKQISPFFVPKILANMAAGMVAIKHGLRGGPISSAVTACATGAHNVGEAFERVSSGACDAAVCGATEACITPVGIGGFCRMNAMAVKYNDRPEAASRPFDVSRCGFVMGEGAGMLVIEEMESALRRGAHIYCEIRGFGLSSDAYHIASPHPEGIGATRCVAAALEGSGLGEDPSVIGYANAHATSTPMGDEIELNALATALRPTTGTPAASSSSSAAPLAVSSVKGAMGHLLGAAGAVEAIATILALHTQTIPPNANLENPVPHDANRITLPTSAVRLGEADKPLVAAISTSFGFGGANAALLFTKTP